MTRIIDIRGREILDSRGNPTVMIDDHVKNTIYLVTVIRLGSTKIVGCMSCGKPMRNGILETVRNMRSTTSIFRSLQQLTHTGRVFAMAGALLLCGEVQA